MASNSGRMSVRSSSRFEHREAVQAGGVDDREVELLFGGAELVEEVEGVVDHPVRTGARTVDLVDHDDGLEAQRQRLAGHEAGLRHRAFDGIDQQQHAVDHRQHALDFTAEVGVARGVDDVDVGTPYWIAQFFDRIVMPRSFSISFESMTRSLTCWFSRKVPDWRSSWSTRVVLPWSTWAMMAMFRMARDMGLDTGSTCKPEILARLCASQHGRGALPAVLRFAPDTFLRSSRTCWQSSAAVASPSSHPWT
jgi:hypothetical protein